MDTVSHFGPLIGLLAVVGIFSIPIIAVICHYGHETVKAWLAIGLKRDMVARGYTAEEIVAVIGTGPGSNAKSSLASVEMAAQGYSAQEITDAIAAEQGSKVKSSLPNVPPAKPIKQPAFGPSA